MGHKTCLRTSSTVSVPEHDDRQIVISSESRNPIIDDSHRKECCSAFFGLHAAGGYKTDDRQPLYCAFDQQLTKTNAIRVVDAPSLEGHV